MSKRESLLRYTHIIKKLRRCPATYEEIAGYLALESELQEYNYNVTKRTFQRDLDEIRALYNIDIVYDFSRKVYYIEHDDLSGVTERILEAFDVFNALNLSDRLSQYIHFESRRPQGTENLYGLLHAIRHRLKIDFTHHNFCEEAPTERTVEPYALKEFRNRWYLLCRDLKDHRFKTFGLDRLTGLEISKVTFRMDTEFNIKAHYQYCFGIISPNADAPEDVILSFTADQGKYIKSMPLHDTQKVLTDTPKELKISLKLYITHDLLMELLSYGSVMKVLAPESLARMVSEAHRKAAKRYSENLR